MTQYDGSSGITNVKQDGAPGGNFLSSSIGEGGVVVAKYSNGKTLNIAKLGVASFQAPDNLTPISAEGFEAEGLRRAAGSPEDVFSKRAAEFTRIRKRIKTFGDYTKVDLLVIKYYDYYMERIKEAEELLKNAGLPEAAAETDERKLVCHNAFKNDNVRKSADGRVIVSGLDGCTRDMSAGDVAHLIRRYIKNPAASQDGVRTVLESYSAKRPLSEAELGIIRGMLIFPYKFLKLCNEHYNKRRVCISEAAVERFENCVSSGDREVRLAGGV